MIDLANARIEPPHAAKARSQRDLAHRQTGFVDQFLGKVQSPCLGYGARCRPQMPQEKAAKMPRTNPQAFRKSFDTTILQATLIDEAQCA